MTDYIQTDEGAQTWVNGYNTFRWMASNLDAKLFSSLVSYLSGFVPLKATADPFANGVHKAMLDYSDGTLLDMPASVEAPPIKGTVWEKFFTWVMETPRKQVTQTFSRKVDRMPKVWYS